MVSSSVSGGFPGVASVETFAVISQRSVSTNFGAPTIISEFTKKTSSSMSLSVAPAISTRPAGEVSNRDS